MKFECINDGEMPEEFLNAVKAGGEVQIHSSIGWLTIPPEELEYRNGVVYRVVTE